MIKTTDAGPVLPCVPKDRRGVLFVPSLGLSESIGIFFFFFYFSKITGKK